MGQQKVPRRGEAMRRAGDVRGSGLPAGLGHVLGAGAAGRGGHVPWASPRPLPDPRPALAEKAPGSVRAARNATRPHEGDAW